MFWVHSVNTYLLIYDVLLNIRIYFPYLTHVYNLSTGDARGFLEGTVHVDQETHTSLPHDGL